MRGPIDQLTPEGKRGWLRSPWVIVASIALAVLTLRFAQLPETAISNGLAFQFAGTTNGALALLRAMQDEQVLGAAWSALWFDFILIAAYSLGLAAVVEWLGRDAWFGDDLTPYAAWGALLAGLMDVIENSACLFMLHEFTHSTDPYLGVPALVAALAALAKWTLFLAVLFYALWELLRRYGPGFMRRKLIVIVGEGGGGVPEAPRRRDTKSRSFDLRDEDEIVAERKARERIVETPQMR